MQYVKERINALHCWKGIQDKYIVEQVEVCRHYSLFGSILILQKFFLNVTISYNENY